MKSVDCALLASSETANSDGVEPETRGLGGGLDATAIAVKGIGFIVDRLSKSS